eukprot:10886470-Alexandrium_andersonii.AAC.1
MSASLVGSEMCIRDSPRNCADGHRIPKTLRAAILLTLRPWQRVLADRGRRCHGKLWAGKRQPLWGSQGCRGSEPLKAAPSASRQMAAT